MRTYHSDPAAARWTLDDDAIRSALRCHIQHQHSQDPDTVLLEELGLCRGFVRIDLVVLNGSIHGYEVKSDRDSLRRLKAQVAAYGKVLDRATLVVGSRLLQSAIDRVPTWWGVMHVRATHTGPHFRLLRPAKKNPHRDARALVELLWADQALALLEARGIARGVRGKPRRFLWERIAQEIRPAEIATAVRERLRARRENPVPE